MRLASLLQSVMGRNSDTNNRSLRADNLLTAMDWDLDSNPELVDQIVKCVKKPVHSEYLRIFTDKIIPKSYIEASYEINQILGKQNVIPLSALPVNLRCVDTSDFEEVRYLNVILNVCANSWHSARGDQKMRALTSGRFSKIHCYRIMKCASTSMYSSLQDVFVGKELHRSYLGSNGGVGGPEWCGYVGEMGTVNFSWSPLGCVTKSFNFSHSHFPVTSLNKYPKSVYKLISIRDPLRRIVSFYNMVKKGNFNSIDHFVEECHPDFIFGQLYFLDQKLSLDDAKRTMSELDRVLIVEESKDWSDQLSSDLGMHIPIVSRNQGGYGNEKESSDELHVRLEKLISRKHHLSTLLEKEYKLYSFAKSL